jgi:hypothetical protein
MHRLFSDFLGEIQAENGIFALFSPKIRTWITMPLKVGIIATSRDKHFAWHLPSLPTNKILN